MISHDDITQFQMYIIHFEDLYTPAEWAIYLSEVTYTILRSDLYTSENDLI